ncbi:MAG: hypothetical protein ACRD38_02345 [Nitrososphaerales archaeon]
MPTWKKDAKEFTVSVAYGKKDIKIAFPKPLAEFLGKPKKITFKIEGKKVIVSI